MNFGGVRASAVLPNTFLALGNNHEQYDITVYDPSDDAGLAEVAAVDAAAFAGQVAYDVEEIRQVARYGFVLGVSRRNGPVLASVQVVTTAMSEAVEPLLQEMPPDIAYLAGVCKSPAAEEKGLGRVALQAADNVLAYAYPHIARMVTSCRPENASFQGLATGLGYVGTDICTEYYPCVTGSGSTLFMPDMVRHPGARLIMYRKLGLNAGRAYCDRRTETSLEVRSGDSPDSNARAASRRLMSGGYLLHTVTRKTEDTFVQHYSPATIALSGLIPPFN